MYRFPSVYPRLCTTQSYQFGFFRIFKLSRCEPATSFRSWSRRMIGGMELGLHLRGCKPTEIQSHNQNCNIPTPEPQAQKRNRITIMKAHKYTFTPTRLPNKVQHSQHAFFAIVGPCQRFLSSYRRCVVLRSLSMLAEVSPAPTTSPNPCVATSRTAAARN